MGQNGKCCRDKALKILQVFDTYDPNVGKGTVMLLRGLCESLAEGGHLVTLYATDYKMVPKNLKIIPTLKLRIFHCWLKIRGLYIAPAVITEARNHITDFDVVHLHCFRSFLNIVVCHYARKYGIPFVFDTHGSLPRIHFGKRGLLWLAKWLYDLIWGNKALRVCQAVIAEGNLGVKEYKEFGVPNEKIAIIVPPFDTEGFNQLPERGIFRNRYNLEQSKIVLFIGRINKIKGLEFLVRSFAHLLKWRNNVVLVMVGNDEEGYKAYLDGVISNLGIGGSVLYTGFLMGKDKLSALVDADVVVQTSLYEQGAWAPLEAVLCNTPIVVSNNSGAGDDVRKLDAGYLIEYGNELELAHQIEWVLDNPQIAKIKTIAARQRVVDELSMAKNISRYEAVYKR